MDYIALLRADIDKGFSKSGLEKLIGLPKNNLSGILKGDRELSKKSKLKIERWVKSEKPDPLSSFFITSTKQVKEPNPPEPPKEENPKKEKSNMPDPKDKTAYLKWLRNN